jgi:hypothetical protein
MIKRQYKSELQMLVHQSTALGSKVVIKVVALLNKLGLGKGMQLEGLDTRLSFPNSAKVIVDAPFKVVVVIVVMVRASKVL